MDKKTVLILGGGISGLTAATYLSERGFKVTLVETLSEAGGVARSYRYEDSKVPSSYSWRGWGQFYHNIYDVMKKIPYKDGTVYDQLSRPMKFHLLDDKSSPYIVNQKPDEHYYIPYSWRLSRHDKIKLGWLFAKGWSSGEARGRGEYAEKNMYEALKETLSPIGAKTFAYVHGPFVGSCLNRCSMYHSFNFFQRFFFPGGNTPHWHYDKDKDEYWKTEGRTGWSMLNGPTNEVFFNPFVAYLESKGVEFKFNTSVYKLNYDGCKITSVEISDNNGNMSTLSADNYILAINPFNTIEILNRTPELLEDPQLGKFRELTNMPEHRQISYRMIFSEKINFPYKMMGFVLTDSEFNLCFFSEDQVWNKDIYLGDGVRSLWSGTATVDSTPGKLFNKPLKSLRKEEFIAEVHYQMYKCKTLDDMIKCANNGRDLKSFGLIQIEVWPEWEFVDESKGITEVKGKFAKWVNETGGLKHQPQIETNIPNLYLAGAHVDVPNGTRLWSMENSALVSRKCSDLISGHKTVILQGDPPGLMPFKELDDTLYELGLPNVLVVIWVIMFCVILIAYFVYERPIWLLVILVVMITFTVIVST
jgi:uncharacterized protein with NAD-binding domain and iron-sulfur cluster